MSEILKMEVDEMPELVVVVDKSAIPEGIKSEFLMQTINTRVLVACPSCGDQLDTSGDDEKIPVVDEEHISGFCHNCHAWTVLYFREVKVKQEPFCIVRLSVIETSNPPLFKVKPFEIARFSGVGKICTALAFPWWTDDDEGVRNALLDHVYSEDPETAFIPTIIYLVNQIENTLKKLTYRRQLSGRTFYQVMEQVNQTAIRIIHEHLGRRMEKDGEET